MKKAIFGKAVSAFVAVVMLMQLFAVSPVLASEVLYSQDFENVDLSDLSYDIPGNTTMRLLTNTAGNSTTFYNYYTDNAGGGRASTLTLNAGGVGAGVGVDFSMKLRLVGGNRDGSEIELQDNSGTSIFSFATSSLYMSRPTFNGDAVTLTTAKTAELGLSNYEATGWLQVDARIDFRTEPAAVDLKVTDITNGNKVVYESQYTTTASNISKIYGLNGRSNGAIAYDDIIVTGLTDEEMGDVVTYYTVSYNVEGTLTSESVAKDGFPAEIPDTAKLGYIFSGWQKDGESTLYTSEGIAAMAITADTVYTAVYEEDPDYIENLEAVELVMPNGDFADMSDSTDTYADNIIKLKMTGERGNDITGALDSRVEDFSVNWEFIGYDILNGEPTGDLPTGIDGEYALCDSYGYVTGATQDSTEVNFGLKNTQANYYGIIRATVTYNKVTLTAENSFIILGSTAQDSAIQIPKAGYVSDYNLYADGLVGYEANISGDNKAGSDNVLGDWWVAGGSPGRKLVLSEDDGGKFLTLSTDTLQSSCFAVFQTQAQSQQVIIDQMVRFHTSGSSILFKTDNPVTWKDASTSMAINFTGSALTINDEPLLSSASADTWYRIVISVDASSGVCYAMVYNLDGEKIGESEKVGFVDALSLTPMYYCFRTPDRVAGSLDFNNVVMKRAAINTASMNATAADMTIAIPQQGEAAVSTSLSVSALTTDGYEATGKAVWSIGDESITDVTITPDENDSHLATLTVGNSAPAGDLPVDVVINGVQKSVVIKLTSTQENVVFTSAPASISIPEGQSDAVYKYVAEVRDGQGSVIEGRDITYEIYDKNNSNILTDIEGITFEDGVMTVSSDAKPQTLWVRASAQNTDGDMISKSVKVVVHGLAFDFGMTDEEAAAEGYTIVSENDIYDADLGYGIEGTASSGGTASVTDADSDYLSGSFVFKANVTPGKIYNVTVNYSGSLAWEKVNADLTGVIVSQEEKAAVTYEIPVVDGVLDLNFTNAVVSSVMIESQDAKQPAAKPYWFAIGDSTIANNGSWAYVLARDIAMYPELGDKVIFENRGRGSRNLSTYYTQGILDNVLKSIHPGDVVSISSMGTNGMGSQFEDSLNYYIDACIAMGAKVVLGSYTPHGAVGNYTSGYNSDTQTFDSYRRDSYDEIIRSVYEARYDELLGFVDIGKLSDAAFNAAVVEAREEVLAAGGEEDVAWAAGEAKAQEIIACFGDHNHYSEGSYACSLILGAIVPEMAALVSTEEFSITNIQIVDGKVVVSCDVKNIDGEVIVAVYKNGQLVESAAAVADVTGNTFTASFEVALDGEYDINAFIWDSLDTMKPAFDKSSSILKFN